jgi:hypothetical protein
MFKIKFMKKIFLLLMVILNPFLELAIGQNVIEQKSECIDGVQNGLVIEINSTIKNVEIVLEKRLKGDGLMVNTKKGFYTCMAQNWARIGTGTMDYYFKVTKIDKNKSSITMFISKGYNNFLSSESNKMEIENAKIFMNSLINDSKKYEIELSLITNADLQKENIKDTEKLIKAVQKANEEIEELKKKIEENTTEQKNKSKEMENLKMQEAELKGQLDIFK